MPEPKTFGKRALAPLWMQRITVVVGEPFSFDIPRLQEISRMAVQGKEPALASFGAEAVKGSSPTARTPAEQEVSVDSSAGLVDEAEGNHVVTGAAPLTAAGKETTHHSKAGSEAAGTSGSGVRQSPHVEATGNGRKQEQSAIQIQEGGAVQDEATRRLFSHITAEVRKQLWAVVSDAHRRQATKQRQ